MSRVGLLPLSSHSPPWGLSMLGPLTFFSCCACVDVRHLFTPKQGMSRFDREGKSFSLSSQDRAISLPSLSVPRPVGDTSVCPTTCGGHLLRLSHDLWGTPSPSVPRPVGDTSTVILRDRVETRAGLASPFLLWHILVSWFVGDGRRPGCCPR